MLDDILYKILHSDFDLETHKKTFVDYLEVVIREDGTIEYAVPSHTEKLIKIICDMKQITRDELMDYCEKNDIWGVEGLCALSHCISVWSRGFIGTPNEQQKSTIDMLYNEGLLNKK